MKSVTKTLTISTNNGTVQTGLTNEQLASLHCMHITSSPVSDDIGWYYVGAASTSYLGQSTGTQLILNNGVNRGLLKAYESGYGTFKITFYYFD